MIKAMVDNDKPAAAKAILTYAFFWYNFMPLARGTAVVGYITILSMFMAAGMPVTAAIPKVSESAVDSTTSRHLCVEKCDRARVLAKHCNATSEIIDT
jgi:hypothetical protein